MPDETVNCTNHVHPRPVAAVARVFWPDGRFQPETACIGDLYNQVRTALHEHVPLEVWPVSREPDRGMGWGRWRRAPDCDRCKDTGRFRETNEHGGSIEGHCGCKRGRRMSELWYASKHGHYHPDAFEPEPDFDPDGAPF